MDRKRDIEELALTFLRAMHLSLSLSVSEAGDHIRVDLEGADAYLLLERKAAGLEALQLLLGKVVERQCGIDQRLVVDCEGYRRGREQKLVEDALRAAEKALRTRTPQELPEMNPYERRLVHLALKDTAGIATHSEGDGFTKRVVIAPT